MFLNLFNYPLNFESWTHLSLQKATGVTDSPSKSVYSFLDDPARYGADPDHERSAKGNQHSGGRRKQQVRGGQESDIGGGRGRRKDQRGRGVSFTVH